MPRSLVEKGKWREEKAFLWPRRVFSLYKEDEYHVTKECTKIKGNEILSLLYTVYLRVTLRTSMDLAYFTISKSEKKNFVIEKQNLF